MGKGQEESLKKGQEEEEAKSRIWDCDSCLYDSFELTSFKHQLDSAIASRSMSMPHLSEHRRAPMAGASSRKMSSMSSSKKITRSFQKLIKVVFRKKPSSGESVVGENMLYVIHPGSQVDEGLLPRIPESGEGGVESAGITPDFDLRVWRSASERFKSDGVAVSWS